MVELSCAIKVFIEWPMHKLCLSYVDSEVAVNGLLDEMWVSEADICAACLRSMHYSLDMLVADILCHSEAVYERVVIVVYADMRVVAK